MYGRIRLVSIVTLAVMLITVSGMAQDTPATGTKTQYKGAPISLDVQDAEITTVLRSLAGFSGANIVASPNVTGKVTVKLEDVPWEEALTVILRAHNFDYIEENGIYRIGAAEDLRQEKLSTERARKQVEDLSQLQLGLVKLRYANGEEVKDALEKMLSKRGNIDVDVRTNSLLINDIQQRVELIKGMALKLDTRTPQVEINARLVDIDQKATKELGINWSLANFQSPGNNVYGGGEITNQVQNPAGNVRVGTVRDWGDLMVTVQALENDNKAHLISNPVITTTDNREASILVGQKIPLIVSDQAGNAITQLTTIGIMLKVTPHINNENRITLDVHNEVSDLSSQATVQGGVIINTSESDTRVLVEDGETAIIAGLVRSVESTLHSGIPVLQNLPLLGALFRHSTAAKDSRELVIFVTPRIVKDSYMNRPTLTSEGGATYNPEHMDGF